MKPPAVKYARVEDVSEAVALLTEHGTDAKVLAGGQSLVPLMSFRLARPSMLIDINRVGGLDHIVEADGGLLVGAMTRQRELETSPLAASVSPLLPEALAHVAHIAIRNRGTVGGSLAHADPAAELPTLVTGLGGELHVQGPRETRTIAAEDFFVSTFTTSMAFDEVLTGVRLPGLPAGTGMAMQELTRRHGDFAIVGAMAAVHVGADGTIDLARLALSGVDSTPVRMHAAEAVLDGAQPTPGAIDDAVGTVAEAIHPSDDVHAPASYRRDMAALLLRRVLQTAIERNGTGT